MRFIVELVPGTYIEWSTIVDSPVGWTMSADQVRALDLPAEQVEQILTRGTNAPDRADPQGVWGYNRGGPGEECLTPQALAKYYADADSHAAFTLAPEHLLPYSTVELLPDGTWSEPQWVPAPPI